MNLPNKLTVLRILMVPFFIVFAIAANRTELWYYYLVAGILFAAASFTDYLDGKIARRDNLVTNFGKFADPLADKILTTTAFLYLMSAGVCDPLVICLIMAREFAVAGIRMVAAGAKDGQVIAANSWGKLKTVVQMLTILVFYFGKSIPNTSIPFTQITWWMCWAVAVITVISGGIYLSANKKYLTMR